MATRTVPGASDKPARRVVPGALPPAPKPGKKGKAASKDTSPSAVKVTDATGAALLSTAPSKPDQVANGLKVTPQDLAEQAETQAAVAAVKAVESPAIITAKASTPAQKVISSRIAELSKKSKTATITVAVDELKSLLIKVQDAEQSTQSPSSSSTDTKGKLVLLLQFLHLFNLYHPNPAGPPSFAPRSMPPALEMSTGQQVAALAKLYDALANGPLEGGGGDALQVLGNIESGSSEKVLEDVSYGVVRDMILKLTAPPSAPVEEPKGALDGPPRDFVKASSPPVSFMQASELNLDASKAEPAGGQPDTVPASGSGESSKGKSGGAGVVIGDKKPTLSEADGTAKSEVKEPVNTSEVKKTAESKLNWAALAEEDDDDLGEAPVFEPLPSRTTSAIVTPAPGTPTGAIEPQAASAKASADTGEAPTAESPKQKKDGGRKQSNNGSSNNSKGGAGGARTNGKGGASGAAKTAAAAVKAPKVDEDGFILQESKRTKYLQQKQQQQQQQHRGGGSGRGGKGSNAGRGVRSNADGNRGPKNAEGKAVGTTQ
ncbi:uncharacterized protein MEPE_00640 [Melanopsichium pennsylvanicum]|uniref:Uncharacterized protein n=2 Tax=Melanopsichium pennsylvanicum TaxID=63383 RepID=A0AAJ4XGA8_9BASI|nr:putative protein [Melanopsichium pennsylvanicum 4]SNX81935.1 uncharacterized protein MEPE_00640 [Melanopsichium pennsylvanicum]